MRSALLFFIGIVFAQKLDAQTTPSWIDTLSGNAGQIISGRNSIVLCYSGNTVIADTFLIHLVKFDSVKNIQWSSEYGSEFNITQMRMAMDSTGHIYVLASALPHILLLKFDGNGNFLWVQKYTAEDVVTSLEVKISPQNNVVVSMDEYNQKGSDYAEVLKYDSLGNNLWQKTVSDPQQENLEVLDFTFDVKENLYFTGNVTYDYSDVIWLKISSDGKITSEQYLNLGGDGAPEFGNSIISDHGRFTYLTGMIAVHRLDYFGDKMVVAKYDTSGNLIWLTQFPDSSVTNKFYNGWKLILSSNETLYALGSFSSDTGNSNDYLVLNYDTSGNLVWNKLFYLLPPGGFSYYEPTNFLQGPNHLFYAGAPPHVCSRIDSNYISFIAFDESGALKTLRVYSPDWESCSICADLTVDARGNIYTLDNIYAANGFQLLLTEFSTVLTSINSPDVNKNVSVYPAVNDGDFRINLNPENIFKESATLQILNVMGDLVYRAPIEIKNGSAKISLHLKNRLSAGPYVVRIVSSSLQATTTILVVK